MTNGRRFANLADLMRVKGVGEDYSNLLEAAGVDTVKELRRRNPANLTTRLVEVNNQQRLVRRIPTEAMVQDWVRHAATLKPITETGAKLKGFQNSGLGATKNANFQAVTVETGMRPRLMAEDDD